MSIQPSIGEDIFYPSDWRTLESMIRTTLMEKSSTKSPDILQAGSSPDMFLPSLPAALLTPHAAYQYTLPILGAAYRLALGMDPDHILILAPLHRQPFPEDSSCVGWYPGFDAFSCASRTIAVDHEYIRDIAARFPQIQKQTAYFEEEPALELQLPFIHFLFPGKPVVPLITGKATGDHARILASLISSFPPERTLCIATSNLSGYLPAGRAADHAETASALLTGKKSGSLLAELHAHRISMCGTLAADALRKTGWFSNTAHILATDKTGHEGSGKTTYLFSACFSQQTPLNKEAQTL